jgi:hypothetical protein
VCLTHAAVPPPLPPGEDDAARRLIEHCCRKEAKQPWDLGQPPQKTDRAVRVHVMFTLLMFALATAYRLRWEQAALGAEPVGWQRWRRQLLEPTRDTIIVLAQRWYGIFPRAACALLVGVKLTDGPPGLGTPQAVLTKHGLTAEDSSLDWNFRRMSTVYLTYGFVDTASGIVPSPGENSGGKGFPR